MTPAQIDTVKARRLAKILAHAANYGGMPVTKNGQSRGDMFKEFVTRIQWTTFRKEYVSTLRGQRTWMSQEEAERLAAQTWHLITGEHPPESLP